MAVRIECTICRRIDFATGDVGPALRGWLVKKDRRICPKCATYEPATDDDESDVPQELS